MIGPEVVNLRSGPGAETQRKAVLQRGTCLTFIAQPREEKSRPDLLARKDQYGSSFATSAMQYAGRPYRRGSSLPSRGFDCSGLVYRVLLSHGVNAPRSSAAMFSIGKPVQRSQLQPGDLIFFRDTYRKGISHVGIYVGNHRFIHSSQPGSGVVVTSLDCPYFKKRWAGARRIQ